MDKGAAWQICEEVFEWRLREFPEFATFCGIHDSDDRLNDHSVEAFKRREGEVREFLLRCEALEESSWGPADQLNLTLLITDLRTFLNGTPYAGYVYALNMNEGLPLEFGQLTSWMEFKTVHDYRRYVARLKALPARMASDIECMKLGINKGFTLNRVSLRGLPEQLEAMCDAATEDTDFYAPFVAPSTDLDETLIAEMRTQVARFINDELKPSIQQLSHFITQVYLPACRDGVGLSAVPNGTQLYDMCLQYHTGSDITAQQVHDLGLTEVARIRAQMEKVKISTGFEGNLSAFIQHLRTDPKFYYSDKESLLEDYRDITDNQIRPTLPQLFRKIPTAKLNVESAPAAKAGGPMAYYLAGTMDGSRPGKVYINTHNLTHCPKYDLMTLALHEGEPGHHFQGMYAVAACDIPRFRRYMEDMYYNQMPTKFSMHCSYAEGWGLYCEFLGNELGLYKDPYALFGHLSFEMHRACRLVADTGLHVLGWTQDQAIQLFLENTALAKASIENEVRRYITWPAQACAYKIGQLKIMELREKAAKELGDKFDVRDFHEEVLQCGMVPLDVLASIIDVYIARTLRG